MPARHYPRFLFGLPPLKGENPAFMYHDVDPDSFEADLCFLRDNGYRTLSTAEFLQNHGKSSSGRDVLLTFDDARRNFWEVAFPLLQKFNLRATLFVPTHWMAGAQHGVANDPLEECRRAIFMSWDQLRACSRSGLIDVQSHGHRHALVHISQELLDFASPESFAKSDVYDWPMQRDGQKDISGPPPPGTPIYEAAPLFSANLRLMEDPTVTAACQAFAAAHGGADFFRRADWRDRLVAVHKAAQANSSQVAPLDQDSLRSLVESDFLLSNKLLRAELGIHPRYLAFPWWLGSDSSIEAAARCGIEAVFGTDNDFRRARVPGRPISVLGRVTAKWLRFMPGKGRLQLHRPEVIYHNFRHFFQRAFLAH